MKNKKQILDPYTQNKQYTIYQASCLDVMDSLPENSIDAIVTDPPYEINFMNKGWDNTGIAFDVETWKKALRVLKPGGILLAFNHSRTFHRMMVAIEDAGFELRDTIMWLYGSGFPKSHNIAKAIDKKGGNPLIVKEIAESLKNAREEKQLTKSYCDKMFCNSSTNWSWYEGRNGVARVPDEKTFDKICKLFPSMIKYKNDIKELQTIIGTYERTKNSGGMPLQGECNKININITIPTSDLAQKWNGYGTALKPAFEPIVMARKPFKGSVAENVLKYGTGGININECRIETDETIKNHSRSSVSSKSKGVYGDSKNQETHQTKGQKLGRFPANIIHDGSEEVTSRFPNTKSGDSNGFVGKDTNKIFGKYQNNVINPSNVYADEGNASRYFYCAKASVKDRDDGLEEFNKQFTASAEFRPNHMEKALQGENGNPYGRWQPRKNIHPTVKPTELMQYLVRLVTPKGGTILDPFMGSGSTGKAAMIENTEHNANYHFIGIDLDRDEEGNPRGYCDIAKARIEFGINYRKLEKEKQESRTVYENGIKKHAKQESLF